MAFVILQPDQRYTVGKIIGVGRNYGEHIKEMDARMDQPPVLFLKPPTAILSEGELINLPAYSKNIHHEIELALLVGKKGKNIERTKWREYIAGAGIALDLTLRDLQNLAKQQGDPWSVCKGFDGSCPISTFTPLHNISDLNNLPLQLTVNNRLRQKATTAEMIYPVDKLVSYISEYFTLEAGDILLTGTPAGVGPINSGDLLHAEIGELGKIEFKVG